MSDQTMIEEVFGGASPKDGELTPWILCVTTRYAVGGARVEMPLNMSTFHPMHFDETLSMRQTEKRLKDGLNALGLSIDDQSFETTRLPCFDHELISVKADPFGDHLMIFESFADAIKFMGSKSNRFAAQLAENVGAHFEPAIEGRSGVRLQVNDGLAEVFRELSAKHQRKILEKESMGIDVGHASGVARL